MDVSVAKNVKMDGQRRWMDGEDDCEEIDGEDGRERRHWATSLFELTC